MDNQCNEIVTIAKYRAERIVTRAVGGGGGCTSYRRCTTFLESTSNGGVVREDCSFPIHINFFEYVSTDEGVRRDWAQLFQNTDQE